MAGFFSSQLDFILFFYGLAFILLGATCAALARGFGENHAWLILGLFGFLHGSGEWLDLTALVLGDTPAFAAARVALMASSFILLLEFARREAVLLGLRWPRVWLYMPLVAAVALAGAIDGANSAGIFARYALGFTGAGAASLVFARLARDFSDSRRILALGAAAGFALYAIATGVVVPAAAFWPASTINYVTFLRVTGVPVQLVRGILACWISFSVWAIWGQQLALEVSAASYTRFLRRQFIWTLALLAAILVAGWTLTEFLGGIYKENVQQEARGDIDLLVSHLARETATVEGMVKVLAASPAVSSFVVHDNKQDLRSVKLFLDRIVDASGARAGFIVDREGALLASSGDRSGPPTRTYRGVPYFQKALAGEAGHQFVAEAHDDSPVYFASYPIYDDKGGVAGVAVLEKSLAVFEADLSEFDWPYFLIDPNGIVTLTNRPNMLHRELWPLSAAQTAAGYGRIGEANDRPLLPQEIVDSTWITVNGDRDFVRRRNVNHSDWSLVILKPPREIYASRVLGIVTTLLVAIISLIYMFGRERSAYDRVQMERRLNLQALAQDLRSQATTDVLTGLNNRLKFNQSLAAEMARAARYRTPLSLTLFDVDHFKEVNDSYGHNVGDKVLRQFAAVVTENSRNTDILARWGGEEFVMMLPGNAEAAVRAAEKLRAAVAQTAFDIEAAITCSFGVAEYADGDTPESFVARADRALYQAKLKGRNRVEVSGADDLAKTSFASVA
ncbi:MAG TPA: diguanylate cyclase [Xanthobacteraceae bacterium]